MGCGFGLVEVLPWPVFTPATSLLEKFPAAFERLGGSESPDGARSLARLGVKSLRPNFLFEGLSVLVGCRR